MFCESGYDETRKVVLRWFASRIQSLTLEDTAKDNKTRLQEFLQQHKIRLPEYKILSVSGTSQLNKPFQGGMCHRRHQRMLPPVPHEPPSGANSRRLDTHWPRCRPNSKSSYPMSETLYRRAVVMWRSSDALMWANPRC